MSMQVQSLLTIQILSVQAQIVLLEFYMHQKLLISISFPLFYEVLTLRILGTQTLVRCLTNQDMFIFLTIMYE